MLQEMEKNSQFDAIMFTDADGVDHASDGREKSVPWQEFLDFMDKDNVIEAMSERDDLCYEAHVIKNGRLEWEHMNIICLERNEGQVSKVLFIRQNITELKEKELRVQKERMLANRKERQYQIAIMSNSFCRYEFNLTQDLVEQDIVRTVNGQEVSLLDILEESLESYSDIVNIENLTRCFERGEREVIAEY